MNPLAPDIPSTLSSSASPFGMPAGGGGSSTGQSPVVSAPGLSPYAQIGQKQQLPTLDSRTQLFVGNLPFRVRWQDLKDLMRKCGTVLRADVALSPGDGRSRGFGIVLFAKREDAIKAIEMYNGFNWQNRVLDVRIDSQDPTGAIAMAEANRLAAMQHTTSPQPMPLAHVWPDQSYPAVYHPGQLGVMPVQSGDEARSAGGSPAFLSAPLLHRSASSTEGGNLPGTTDLDAGSTADAANQSAYPPPGMMLVPISMVGNLGMPSPHQPHQQLHGMPSQHGLPGHMASQSLQGYYHAVQHRPSPSSPVPLPPGYANRHLFIGNLPFNCQWQELKDLMRGAGNVLRADIAQGSDGRSRGFGSVLFATPQDAERAVQMFNGFDYSGRALKVHFDKFSATSTMMPNMPYPGHQAGMMHHQLHNGRHSPLPQWAPQYHHDMPHQHPLAQQHNLMDYAYMPSMAQHSAHEDRHLAHQQPQQQQYDEEIRQPASESNGRSPKGSGRPPPSSIELPPPNPFAFSMLTGGVLSPRQGNIPPMTPSMPAFTLGAFPPTPPVYPQFFSPGMGPASPHAHDGMPGASYFSGAMGGLNVAPGALVERQSAVNASYFPTMTVPPGEDVPPSQNASRRPSTVVPDEGPANGAADASRKASTDTNASSSSASASARQRTAIASTRDTRGLSDQAVSANGLSSALGQLGLSDSADQDGRAVEATAQRRRSYVHGAAPDFNMSDWRRRLELANSHDTAAQRRASYDTHGSIGFSSPFSPASANGPSPVRPPHPSAPGSNASGSASPPRLGEQPRSPPSNSGVATSKPLNAATYAAFHSAGAIGSGIAAPAPSSSSSSSPSILASDPKKPAFGTSIWASK